MSLNSAMPAAIVGAVCVACFQNNLMVPSGGLMIGWQGVCEQRFHGWNWKGRRGHHRARGHQKNWLWERVSVPANGPPIVSSRNGVNLNLIYCISSIVFNL